MGVSVDGKSDSGRVWLARGGGETELRESVEEDEEVVRREIKGGSQAEGCEKCLGMGRV